MSLKITPMLVGHVPLKGLNEGRFHQGHCQAMRRFGVHFQAAYFLGSLMFWSPINKRLQTFWAIFVDILTFGSFFFFFFFQPSAFMLLQLRSLFTLFCGFTVFFQARFRQTLSLLAVTFSRFW